MGNGKEPNLPPSGKPSRDADAGTVGCCKEFSRVLYLWRAKDSVP